MPCFACSKTFDQVPPERFCSEKCREATTCLSCGAIVTAFDENGRRNTYCPAHGPASQPKER